MQCPHCGYMMLPVDKDCARCRQRGYVPPQNAAPPPMPGVPSSPANPPQAAPLYAPPSWSATPPPFNNPYAPPASYPQPPAAKGPASTPPYMPAPFPAPAQSRSSNEPSTATQVLVGILGVLLLIGYVGLRVYLAEQRAARRDAAMLEMNQRYNETLRPQFDNMRNMEQQGRQNALDAGSRQIIVNPPPVIVNQPQPIIVNTQSGLSPGQFAAMQLQQEMQMQRMQSQQDMQMQQIRMQQQMQDMHNQNMMQMQNMQNRMMQRHVPFGRGF